MSCVKSTLFCCFCNNGSADVVKLKQFQIGEGTAAVMNDDVCALVFALRMNVCIYLGFCDKEEKDSKKKCDLDLKGIDTSTI